MKKTLLALSLASFAAVSTVQAQTYFTEDFNASAAPALPASWTSNPAGQWMTGAPNTIAPNALAGLGYDLNQPTYTACMGINGKLAAANGAVLSTPSINIPAGASTAAIFFDKAYFGVALSADPTKKETLTFLVSTNGGTTWTDVQDITKNSNYFWERGMIPVGTYAGQTVKFGFRYKNEAAALVGVVFDNIKVFMGSDISLVGAAGGTNPAGGKGYQLSASGAPVKGTVQNLGTSPITAYTVWYKQGASAAVSYAVTGANIAPLATGTFTHATNFTAAANSAYPIKVWVVLPSDNVHTNDSADITVVGVPFIPGKKLVLEEGTGTWCGWCPRGSVFMEDFAQANVGKAAQIAVHNQDPMTISAYDSYMAPYVGGFPNMVIDRTSETDPSDINDVYTALKDNFGFADVTMGTPTVTGTTVTVPVTVKPAVNITNPKMALVVTESNVTGTGTNWPQTNYYAGGGNGTMGGWESQAAHVNSVNFHFVARAISPSPAGDAAGLPASMVAGTTYNATLTATLNSAWKPADLQYIALFMNGTDATIMNSSFSPLPTLKPGLPTGTSVTNVNAGIEKAQLYPNPASDVAYMQVVLNEKASATITITDAVGRAVAAPIASEMHSGSNIVTIPTANLANGMYLINMNTTKGNVSMKLQIVK